jgi:uncharacterized lipoprotein YmbA
MRLARARLPFFLMVCLLPGCKSATVHLYTLVPATAVSISHEDATPAPFTIEGVVIPRIVDRKELVVRRSAREVVLLENALWAAPLRDEVRRALATDLRLALGAPSIGAPSPITSIWIDIRDWEASANTVYLKAEWRLRRSAPGEPLDIRCESDLMERTSGQVDDLVRTDQALLEKLAQRIARALRFGASVGCGD